MERWENQGSPQTSLSAPAIPQNIPFPPTLHRSSFPDSTEAFDPRKPDPYELYEKSRAIYESRRKWKNCGPLRQALETINHFPISAGIDCNQCKSCQFSQFP